MSVTKIASLLGCGWAAVKKQCQLYGIVTRTSGGWTKENIAKYLQPKDTGTPETPREAA
jgi:hypothetical protein